MTSDSYAALTVRNLDSAEIDVVLQATGRVSAGEDAIDFVSTDRDAGEVSVGGDLEILFEAFEVMAEESGEPSETLALNTHDKVHEAYMDTVGDES